LTSLFFDLLRARALWHAEGMKGTELKQALAAAVQAARLAGGVMRKNLHAVKRINEEHQHDIKLELDVRCQRLIEKTLGAAFRDVALLGEEGITGDLEAAERWVVDPIDGTVNFAYGIPHAAVSIALQTRKPEKARSTRRSHAHPDAAYETQVGVVYEPFCDELWTAIRGQPARLNGRTIRASKRRLLREAIVSVGFAKQKESIQRTLPAMQYLVHRVRKIRIMGSAALSLVYVASGRFDAYVEAGIRLWDIAAGGLILECAGGEFWHRPIAGEHVYELNANNGWLRRQLSARKTETADGWARSGSPVRPSL
jgi:myo-inositol-1(or 4)-monophosphatase